MDSRLIPWTADIQCSSRLQMTNNGHVFDPVMAIQSINRRAHLGAISFAWFEVKFLVWTFEVRRHPYFEVGRHTFNVSHTFSCKCMQGHGKRKRSLFACLSSPC